MKRTKGSEKALRKKENRRNGMLCVSLLHYVPPDDRDCGCFIFASWHNVLSVIETRERFLFLAMSIEGW